MIIAERMAPKVDDDFVLFLIGMRINKFYKVKKWWPIFQSMPRMIKELENQKNLGLLHARSHFGFRNFMLIQYWESWEKLTEYASDQNKEHRPAWTDFFRHVGTSGDVGIWHETYKINRGNVEAIYGNMPQYGLGNAFDLVKAEGSMKSAGQRFEVKP
jgi:fumigallin biosynthesis monooxygenase-like protein